MNIYNNIKDNLILIFPNEIKRLIDFILNKIYSQTLSKIKEFIKSSHTIRENGYEYFKQQWTYYSTSQFSISNVNYFIERSSNLNPNPLINPIKDYLQVLRNKSNDIDTFKYYLIMYFKLNDLRIMLLNPKQNHNQNQTKLIKDKFPLEIKIRELEINEILNLNELKNIDIIQEAKLKINNNETNDILIIVYDSFLYFAFYDQANKIDNVIIMFKYSLRNVSLQKDFNGEKCLNILIINNSKSIELSLVFNTKEFAKEFSWKILDKKMAVINNEKMLFYMYFQDIE